MQKNSLKTPLVALITGAGRRIGAEIARTLHADGLNVILHYHTSTTAAEDLCAYLNTQRPDSALVVCADLAAPVALVDLMDTSIKAWGRLDVLVNNAARFYRTQFGTVTAAAWDDLINTNLKAPFFLAQAAAPYLSKQQGCIINIADVHGTRPMRDYSAYCISKAGLIMLTQALAKELGPAIRVNAVSPSPVELPEDENTLTPEVLQKVIDRTALGRIGCARDVAKAVLFFVREANYITGQILAVDGGRSLLI